VTTFNSKVQIFSEKVVSQLMNN